MNKAAGIPDDNNKKKERKKGYNLSDWSGRRSKDNGILYDHNEARYPLPPVGSYVVVRVRRTFERGYGKNHDILGVWELDDNYVDGWGIPLVFKVVEYTKGSTPEAAIDKGNWCILKAKRLHGHTEYVKRISTFYIAIGYYYLDIRENSSQEGLSFRECVDDMPVAEYIPMVRDGRAKDKARKDTRSDDEQNDEKKKR